MHRTNRELDQTPRSPFTRRTQQGAMLLALSASLGATFLLSACGGGDSGGSSDRNLGGKSGFGGSGSSAEHEIDSDILVDDAV